VRELSVLKGFKTEEETAVFHVMELWSFMLCLSRFLHR